MICHALPTLLGLDCVPITDDGKIAMIETPFTFDDGDSLPVFVQDRGAQVRFFDDGGVLMHFRGRGISFTDKRRSRFIRAAAEPFGAVLNEAGELEVWASAGDAPAAFSRYLSTLLAITQWEREQQGVVGDITQFIDEVGVYLHAWKPHAQLAPAPEYRGVTGQVYQLDWKMDDQGVIATTVHPAAMAAAVKKLLDIRSAPENKDVSLLAVIDDRSDSKTAAKDSLVLQVVANVLPFGRLVALAASAATKH